MKFDSDLDASVLAGEVADFIRCSMLGATGPWVGEEFERLALRLFRFQFDNVAPYHRCCEGRGVDPSRVQRWENIPALPVAAFKEHDITSLTPSQRTRVFNSSGTTGREFSRHYHDPVSLGLYETSALAWFQTHLLPDGASSAGRLRLLSLTPDGEFAPNSSLVHMFETVAGAFPWAAKLFAAGLDVAGNWLLNLPAIRRELETATDEGAPLMLLGTAFSFVHLLDFLEGQKLGFRLPAGSRVLETGGYKGKSRELPKEELHAWVCRRLGLAQNQIVSEYGMSELGSQAYDQVAGSQTGDFTGRRFQFPPWARARLISPETFRDCARGEPGLVTILDLANVRSCLAIQTEDLGMVDSEGLQILGRAGRAEPRGCSLMPA